MIKYPILLVIIFCILLRAQGQRGIDFYYTEEFVQSDAIREKEYSFLSIISKNRLTNEEKEFSNIKFNKLGLLTEIRIQNRNYELSYIFHEIIYDEDDSLILYEKKDSYYGEPITEFFHFYNHLDSLHVYKVTGKILPGDNYTLVYHNFNNEKRVNISGNSKTVEKFTDGKPTLVYGYYNGKPNSQIIYTYHKNGLIKSRKKVSGYEIEINEFDSIGVWQKKIRQPKGQRPKQQLKSGEFQVEIKSVSGEKIIPVYNNIYQDGDTIILEQNLRFAATRTHRLVKIIGANTIPHWFQSKVKQNNRVDNLTFDSAGHLISQFNEYYTYDKNWLLQRIDMDNYVLLFNYR